MSSTSPGHVMTGRSLVESTHATPNANLSAVARTTPPKRATAPKRGRDSPSTPSRALAILGNLTDTVRTSAVRGLRALTDTIERQDDSSESSSTAPTSPTARLPLHTTPKGKRRRTVLTDANTRMSHANWRGAQWDYTRAMADGTFYRVGDTNPSAFALPPALVQPQAAIEYDVPDRPGSAMSAASAPAAFSTPQSHRQPHSPTPMPQATVEEEGWVISYEGGQDDPFAFHDSGDAQMPDVGKDPNPLLLAVETATALLTTEPLQSPVTCGAIHVFLARLRVVDPQGSFAPSCPAGESAAAEIKELRDAVSAIHATQVAMHSELRELLARPTLEQPRQETQKRGSDAPAPAPPRGPAAEQREPAVTPPSATPAPQHAVQHHAPVETKEVGRHDERRAVFCPASPFGGRITHPATQSAVRQLNNESYTVRDAINIALRDSAVASMLNPDSIVQVMGVNWTERGNMCVVVCDGFTATQLLASAPIVAAAAALGENFSAHRDIPIFKAVLYNVPTKRADGTLFTEAEILADLRAHSSAFSNLRIADSTEPARWISSADMRTLKPRSTVLINFASETDASKFLAMRRRLFAMGCLCEPGAFQPRDKDRVCTRCWNPLARHNERDSLCKEKCRLCGGDHIEEDHTCGECDVLAKPCAHIKLKCVNCGGEHAANDSACEYRRRMRGTSRSAPPMSSRPVPKPVPSKTAKKKGRNVRILEPHEPFPDDVPTPAQLPMPPAADIVHPSPISSPQVASSSQDTGDTDALMDDAEHAALSDLLGASMLDQTAQRKTGEVRTDAHTDPTSGRRASSSRIAATTAAKEERRRRAARILVRAFKFLDHPAANAALKSRADDYGSTVSWAAEEQSKRNKPGMHGKSAASLRKVVDEMNALDNNTKHPQTPVLPTAPVHE